MTSLRDEILEQPDIVARLIEKERSHSTRLVSRWANSGIHYITIAARGTSDNAATYGKYVFAALAQLPVALATPSLYTLYHSPPSLRDTLLIAISQSGESTDILEVLREAKRQGAPTLAITNRADSTLALEADETILIGAGEEKSIAATKTYSASLAALSLLAAVWSGKPSHLNELNAVAGFMHAVLEVEEAARVLAIGLVNLSDIEIIGRGFNYATAFELALKLKELAYVHAEPYSSADFLHGPVALVDERFRAWVFAPTGATYSNAVEFTERIKRGGARVIGVSDNEDFLNLCDAGMRLPPLIPEWLSPLVAILPGQLFALHLALAKGLDVDHPRNLTKVTYTR